MAHTIYTQLTNELFIKPKRLKQSKIKELSEVLGGVWRYDDFASWYCDDNKRHVTRTCSTDYEVIPKQPPNYWLYGEGAPKLIKWNYENLGLDYVL